MYKTFNFKSLSLFFSLLFLLFLNSHVVYSQGDVGNIIRFGVQDANKLTQAYLKPFDIGLGAGLNNSWFNTAEALKTGRFEFRIIGVGTFIPTKDQSFNINDVGLTSGYQVSNGSTTSPTVFGSDQAGPLLTKTFNVNPAPVTLSANLPQGTGVPIMPMAMGQVNVGIYKGLELGFRFLPNIEIPIDGSNTATVSLFGVGAKWDFQQFIPKVNLLPFNMAVFFGYTSLKVNCNLGLQPSSTATQLNGFVPPQGYYENQHSYFNTKAYNFGLLISKKLSFVTVYGGFRYDASSVKITFTGNYPYSTVDENTANSTYSKEVVINVSDPVNLSSSFNQVGVNLGLRFKVGFMTLSFEGNLGSKGYHSVTTGIGFGRYN